MKLFITVLIFLSLNIHANEVLIKVPGMVCQMCVYGMKKNFKSVVNDPDKDIIVDIDKKTVKVNLARDIKDKEIRKRVTDAGYETESIKWLKKVKKK